MNSPSATASRLPALPHALGAASCAWLLALVGQTHAASNVDLPPSACRPNPALVFAGGFENQPWQAQPSSGSGGASGAIQRTTPGPQSISYWLQAPASRPAAAALVIVLHGAGGAGTAPSNAMATRDVWAPLAEAGGFVVAAPIASGSQGGWVPAVDFSSIDAVVADAVTAYDIDRSRVYVWGFSAGGHIAHTLSLLRNPNRYAAYAVNAGVLEAHAGAQAPTLAPRRVPLLAAVGDSDSLLSFTQADRQRFLNAGWIESANYQLRVFAGGHTYSSDDVAAAWSFFCRHGLLPPFE
ncbi:MAG: hypothetical protein ACT4NL_06480 [Pseudomarimonas sp.]